MGEAKRRAQVGRLSMRQEGEFWNAYYALPNTMEGALLLGSIQMDAVTRSQARKEAFIGLMRDLVGDEIEHAFGVRPTWNGPKPAPEHERTRSA